METNEKNEVESSKISLLCKINTMLVNLKLNAYQLCNLTGKIFWLQGTCLSII